MKINLRVHKEARAIATSLHDADACEYAGLHLDVDHRGVLRDWFVATLGTSCEQGAGYFCAEARDCGNYLGTFFGGDFEYTVECVYDYLMSLREPREFELSEIDEFALRSNFLIPADLRKICRKLEEYPDDLALWSYDDEILCEMVGSGREIFSGSDLVIFNPVLQAAEIAGFLGSRDTAEFLIFDGQVPYLHFRAMEHIATQIGACWEREGADGMFRLPKWR